MKKATVLIYSGGLDSTTLLYHLLDQGHRVRALSVNYGQRHQRELRAAVRIADSLGIDHRVVDLSSIRPLLAGSSQTSDEIPVPDGHYAEESMRATVVPNRNAIMLALAVAWAQSTKSQAVAYAAHGGDHFIYWDCRPAFMQAQRAVYALAEPDPIELLTPFSDWTKADIALLAIRLNVPIAETYSCYKNGPLHCGTCGTCYERREAFTLSSAADPTEYLDSTTSFKAPK